MDPSEHKEYFIYRKDQCVLDAQSRRLQGSMARYESQAEKAKEQAETTNEAKDH